MAFPEEGCLPADFAGVVRIFPLPNLVLFPRTVQLLHVFEPRYREMIADALNGDRLISMARLRPGWEPNYDQSPGIEPMMCIGRILAHSPLADGRSNIFVRGVRRARLLRELPSATTFRQAEVEVLDDQYEAMDAHGRRQAHQELRRRFEELMAFNHSAHAQVMEMFSGDMPLGALSDVMAFSLGLEPEFLQELLGELDVERRARKLLARLELPRRTLPGDFPFSNN